VGENGRFAGSGVHYASDEMVALTVVVDHFPIRSGDPLQHAALLPAPGAGGTERNPAVIVPEIDHAHSDAIGGGGRAVFEIDLVAEAEADGGIELQLVVVAEPVMPGSTGDRSHRGQRGCFSEENHAAGRGQHADGQGQLEQLASGQGHGDFKLGCSDG
jgi:hypothetical protein